MANLWLYKNHHFRSKYPIVLLQQHYEMAQFKFGHPVDIFLQNSEKLVHIGHNLHRIKFKTCGQNKLHKHYNPVYLRIIWFHKFQLSLVSQLTELHWQYTKKKIYLKDGKCYYRHCMYVGGAGAGLPPFKTMTFLPISFLLTMSIFNYM